MLNWTQTLLLRAKRIPSGSLPPKENSGRSKPNCFLRLLFWSPVPLGGSCPLCCILLPCAKCASHTWGGGTDMVRKWGLAAAWGLVLHLFTLYGITLWAAIHRRVWPYSCKCQVPSRLDRLLNVLENHKGFSKCRLPVGLIVKCWEKKRARCQKRLVCSLHTSAGRHAKNARWAGWFFFVNLGKWGVFICARQRSTIATCEGRNLMI